MSTIGFLHFTAAVSRSFLHFRGTNHIGSRLSIRKAGVYFKEQDKKKKKKELNRGARLNLVSFQR